MTPERLETQKGYTLARQEREIAEINAYKELQGPHRCISALLEAARNEGIWKERLRRETERTDDSWDI